MTRGLIEMLIFWFQTKFKRVLYGRRKEWRKKQNKIILKKNETNIEKKTLGLVE